MSQIAPPPSPAPSRVAIASAAPPLEADQPSRSRLWSAVRWPLHQALKGIFLFAAFLARRRTIALGLLVALLVLGGGWWVAAQRAPTRTVTKTVSSISASPTTTSDLISYNSDGLVPLASSVDDLLRSLHGGDAQGFYKSLTPSAQQSAPVAQIQALFDFYKQNGISFQQFIYTGGFFVPGGTSNYTVQGIANEGGKTYVLPWYFEVDTTGKISHFADLTQLIAAFDKAGQGN